MRESFSAGSHLIAKDDIQGFCIETEFLGINHNVTESGPPLWFETMVYRESIQGKSGLKIEYGTVRPPRTVPGVKPGVKPRAESA